MKRYIGDGVYVVVERGMLKLTTENGIEVLDTIYLEPEVMNELVRYYEEAKQGKHNEEQLDPGDT